MTRTLRRCTAIASVLLACATVRAQVVDQSYTPTPSYIGAVLSTSFEGRPLWLAQSFTAGLSGQLSAVDLAIWRDAGVEDNLVLQVFEINAQTLGTLLGSAPIAVADVPVGMDGYAFPAPGTDLLGTHVDLSQLGIPVVSGSTYALAVSALNPAAGEPSDPLMLWLGDLLPGSIDYYPGGQMAYTYATTLEPGAFLFPPIPLADVGFRTFVSTVPEAPTAGLALLGLALVLVQRRRKTAR
jgi:MYXO-CTERM domain-containing protein